MSGHVLFFLAVTTGLFFSYGRVRSGRVEQTVVTLISVFIYLFCMWIPALMQTRGVLESKLEIVGFLKVPSPTEFGGLAFRWGIEVFILILAEAVAYAFIYRGQPKLAKFDKITRRNDNGSRALNENMPIDGWRNRKVVALILVALGLAATLLLPSAGLENRGAGGQGIPTMLRTCLVSGLAIIVYFRCFGSKLYLGVLVIGTIILIAANVRSPLVVLFLAYIASEVFVRRRNFTKTRALVLSTVLIIVSIVGSFMSSMRANLTRDMGLSISEVLKETLRDPLVGIYSAGVDTLDGYRFSQNISNYEPARPLDLFLSVLTFIPRAVWKAKPDSISVDMSSKYLGYKASGQFLSPVGYLNLVSGSYWIALLLLFLFGLSLAALVHRFQFSFWLVIVLVVGFRFMLGGSSFDIYYGLVLAIPVLLVKVAVDFIHVPVAAGPGDYGDRRGSEAIGTVRKNSASNSQSA